MTRWAIAVAVAVLVAACGEKPQGTSASMRKSDAQAFQGADNRYVESGWKAGDRATWQEQLRARTIKQNEYARAAGK